jgi:hypothetical protein
MSLDIVLGSDGAYAALDSTRLVNKVGASQRLWNAYVSANDFARRTYSELIFAAVVLGLVLAPQDALGKPAAVLEMMFAAKGVKSVDWKEPARASELRAFSRHWYSGLKVFILIEAEAKVRADVPVLKLGTLGSYHAYWRAFMDRNGALSKAGLAALLDGTWNDIGQTFEQFGVGRPHYVVPLFPATKQNGVSFPLAPAGQAAASSQSACASVNARARRGRAAQAPAPAPAPASLATHQSQAPAAGAPGSGARGASALAASVGGLFLW